MKKIVCLIACLASLVSCGGNQTKNAQASVPEELVENRVELLVFYGAQRCATCRAIEDHSKELVESVFAEDLSSGLLVYRTVDMTTPEGGGTKTVGQLVSFRLAFARVAAPAGGVKPFVSASGSVHVDGNQTDVPAAKLGANAVDSFAALCQRNVFIFRNQQGSVEVFGLEGGHNTPGDFPVVRPFKETAVRRALSCSFTAVSVVD